MVLKRSGTTEPFTREKAVAGVRKACKGRPVSEDDLARLGQTVEDALRSAGWAEVPANEIGAGHPRPAARARRGGLPALRQRLPGLRVGRRLRGRDRDCCAPSARRRRSDELEPGQPELADGLTTDRPARVWGSARAGATSDRQQRPQQPSSTSSNQRRHQHHDENGERRMTETVSGRRERKARRRASTIERVFTTEGVHPYDEVTWERRDVVQTNWKTGETVFEQRGVEFPDFWCVNASTIVTTKYFRGAVGTDAREWSLKQLIDRVVKTYRQGRRGPRLLRDRRRRRGLRARADLAAGPPVLLLQLPGLVQRRHAVARSRSRPASSSPSTTRWTRSSTGTRRRASSSRAAPAPA